MATMVVPYVVNYYTVVVHKAEEGGYWGEILELPGCVSQGETIDEFRNNIGEALEAILASGAETPHIEIYTEPILAEKEFIHFERLESYEEKGHWVEVSENSTATA